MPALPSHAQSPAVSDTLVMLLTTPDPDAVPGLPTVTAADITSPILPEAGAEPEVDVVS